jgi:hypothetical protein
MREWVVSDSGLEQAAAEFESNVERVGDLMDFDRTLLDIVEPAVSSYVDKVYTLFRGWLEEDEYSKIHPSLQADGLLRSLKSVRTNHSLSRAYQEVNNQALVLLVSYFGSAIRRLVRSSIIRSVSAEGSQRLAKEELKLTVSELSHLDLELPDLISEKLIESKGVSFQDMKSIGRALERFTGYEPPRVEHVDDIIAGQAVRHAIVHSGATVDQRLLGQLKAAPSRTVFLYLKVGKPIEVGRSDVEAVASAMKRYMREAVAGIASVAEVAASDTA